MTNGVEHFYMLIGYQISPFEKCPLRVFFSHCLIDSYIFLLHSSNSLLFLIWVLLHTSLWFAAPKTISKEAYFLVLTLCVISALPLSGSGVCNLFLLGKAQRWWKALMLCFGDKITSTIYYRLCTALQDGRLCETSCLLRSLTLKELEATELLLPTSFEELISLHSLWA